MGRFFLQVNSDKCIDFEDGKLKKKLNCKQCHKTVRGSSIIPALMARFINCRFYAWWDKSLSAGKLQEAVERCPHGALERYYETD